MIELYDDSKETLLEQKQQKRKKMLIILNVVMAILIVLIFIFTSRKNQSFMELSFIFLSILLACFDIFYIGVFYNNTKKILKYLKELDKSSTAEYEILSYTVSNNEITKNFITFVIIDAKTNAGNKSFFIEKEKLPLIKNKEIKFLIAKNHYVFAIKEA